VEKVVHFWSMRVRADAGREADHEIDEVRWVPLPDAPGLLSYKHDRGVLAAFARLPRITAEVSLVRHARAGSRSAWHEPDGLRPLDSVGHDQALRSVPILLALAPDRFVAATPVRCRETLTPAAERAGLAVKVDPAFDEDSPDGVPGAAAALLALAAEGGSTVICSQGKVISPLLRMFRPAGTATTEEFETPKGTGWLLAIADKTVIGTDRLVP
jgi:8-oxo-dGTP diphosphatase